MDNIAFEWDDNKNQINQEKHGVSFEVAQIAFDDPYRILTPDLSHSENEQRYYCFGMIEELGVLSVRFTYRNNKIRIIGAGFWRDGKARYHEERNRIH